MKIAIVDDQDVIRYSLRKILQRNEYEVLEYTGQEEDLCDDLKTKKVDILILDVMLEFDKTGIDLLQEIRITNKSLPVILMTAYTTPENVIKATQLDVIEILKKPFEEEELLKLISQIKHEGSDENQVELSQSSEEFVGSFETMKNIYKKIGTASKNDLTVLISGETGTGKELVAKLIHQNSIRKEKPFVIINCASIPSELFESQLFGHEKGSFTGAEKLHLGFAQQVEDGTLFLDEIGELEIQLQSKILRFLENKTFRRIGGKEDIFFQGRILAATNINFQNSIKNNSFREDLYFRLSMLNIELPTLNERKDDIALLAQHFIHLANIDLKTNVHSITHEALHTLESFNWTGNIRQLRNTIYNAVLNAKQEQIVNDDLYYLHSKSSSNVSFENVLKNEMERLSINELYDFKEKIDKKFLEFALNKSSNISHLSQSLKMSRATLRKKISEFDIDVES